MKSIVYEWGAGTVEMVHVPGTNGEPYWFGEGDAVRPMNVGEFWIGTVAVTQGWWAHVMGAEGNPAINRGERHPVENVSWDALHGPGGFFERVNAGEVRRRLAAQTLFETATLRLPSEAEWEYAARGGPAWRDGYRFSGSNEVDRVAWYDRIGGDCTKEVARKEPNQLGLYDMSGNVWEWCEDTFTPDVAAMPADGSPWRGDGAERVLRGGCFHNWAIHCTVAKRYQIERRYHDACIGFRVVLAGGVR